MAVAVDGCRITSVPLDAATPASSEIVNVLSRIVIVPLRAAPVLASALNVTRPLPLPEPDAVIQFALGAADHGHDGSAVTVTVPLPPAAGNDADAGDSVTVQAG